MTLRFLLITAVVLVVTVSADAQQSSNNPFTCNAKTKVFDKEPARAAIKPRECVWVTTNCVQGSARCVCGKTRPRTMRARSECQSIQG
jgi:hypothetical protein